MRSTGCFLPHQNEHLISEYILSFKFEVFTSIMHASTVILTGKQVMRKTISAAANLLYERLLYSALWWMNVVTLEINWDRILYPGLRVLEGVNWKLSQSKAWVWKFKSRRKDVRVSWDWDFKIEPRHLNWDCRSAK